MSIGAISMICIVLNLMQSLYDEIKMHNLDTEAAMLLKAGIEELKQTEAYND